MKLHFEPDLDFQLQAIEAVCDLFRGQETCRTEFTVSLPRAQAPATSADDLFPGTLPQQLGLGLNEAGLGVGNRLTLLDDELRDNLQSVQLRGGLVPTERLASGDFTVEMETGTGKTYVYLRTLFELNKRYGFTKFVIVVPSVAIKEGVYKTLQITRDHFRGLYAGVPFDYFLYDSAKLGQVRNFATSPQIQIMVVTVGAINKKDVNNLYKDSEKTGGEKPIDLIRATRPVLIVDEPQSVDGGLTGKGKEALDAMNPLCTLRYSATHADKHHMVYRLDAVDAYTRKLVKQIEVASATVEDAHNRPYVRLLAVASRRNVISARVELDVASGQGVRRREVVVQDGDDLEQTTQRALYHDCRIGEIRVQVGNRFMELRIPGGEVQLREGESWGDVDPLAVQREMIRRTIRIHLDKELRLRPAGIKVLSLFFIDAVDRYRQYDQEGNPVKGVYARMFEEEYRWATRLPDYQSLFGEVDLTREAAAVHEGYFSIDRKKVRGRTVEVLKDTRGDTQADIDTYNLIMRDKERLLSLDTPLRFIFSHSALREGWDNPNVFQICTLRDIQTLRERRQTIGRGLRLCVNQTGQRVREAGINILTVVATESYQSFADNLQKEIEADTGFRFGVVAPDQFAPIPVLTADGRHVPLGRERSAALHRHLIEHGLLDGQGKVTDTLRRALKEGALAVPEPFVPHIEAITSILRKLAGRLEIRDHARRQPVPVRKEIYLDPEFKALWDRIKHKTTYRVQFDNEKLIRDGIKAVREAPAIARAQLHWRRAGIAIGQGGVEARECEGAATVVLNETNIELPDLLTALQDRTQLTRRSIHRILSESGRLGDFPRNPQQFIELTAEAINRCKRLALVDGIRYQRLGDAHFYAQELFEQVELMGYLDNMYRDARKSVYQHVVYDSDTESVFADQLEKHSAVKLYAKLPGWFRVPTPLGTYNPDWAVVLQFDDEERLYLVVETKASPFADDLRHKERAKILCGKAHFGALKTGEAPAGYLVTNSLDEVMRQCTPAAQQADQP